MENEVLSYFLPFSCRLPGRRRWGKLFHISPFEFQYVISCARPSTKQEALGEICNSRKTPTELIARRTWPGQTAKTTAKPTTFTATSSPKEHNNRRAIDDSTNYYNNYNHHGYNNNSFSDSFQLLLFSSR
jgi:hypothetical protein